jgi:hypothetical protein
VTGDAYSDPSAADGLPFSQAAANNRGPILGELRRLLSTSHSVLEIGSGTGQHALHFAAAMPELKWQPTEHPDALALLRCRCHGGVLEGLAEPRPLDINHRPWDVGEADTIYTANTLHIVGRSSVEAFFIGAAASSATQLLVYGPFNYDGRYTSESNERFDAWLRERDAGSGIRDFEWVSDLAAAGGYTLHEDIAMPANNRLLCWRRDRVSFPRT